MIFVNLLEQPAFGSIIGVISTILAIYFFMRGNKKRIFTYVNKESVIIGDHGDILNHRLAVAFDGKNIERVTRSVFVVWNAGKETIRSNDIAVADPLRIEFPAGTSILLATIDRASRSAIRFQLTYAAGEKPTLMISFDFLDRLDGANFSIVHNAPTGSAMLAGTVLGMQGGPRNRSPSDRDIESFRTPDPVRPRWKAVSKSIIWTSVKTILILSPPIILFSAIYPDPALALFPSLGRPDNTAILVAGHVSLFWVVIGGFTIALECLILLMVLHRPPKVLTG